MFKSHNRKLKKKAEENIAKIINGVWPHDIGCNGCDKWFDLKCITKIQRNEKHFRCHWLIRCFIYQWFIFDSLSHIRHRQYLITYAVIDFFRLWPVYHCCKCLQNSNKLHSIKGQYIVCIHAPKFMNQSTMENI